MEHRYIVDARGEQCPVPVIKTKKVLDSVEGEAVVTVLVDNETAVQNLTRMGKSSGAEVAAKRLGEHEFQVILSVNGAAHKEAPEAEKDTETAKPEENLVVAVDTAVMGHGNDELGKVLMKGFLFAVTQLEKLPKTMLFYNGGVLLTTEGSDSIEDLKNLEAQGVEIKSCGTCLNYYGISDKLKVGEVTNMYDIVETLAAASKVIKP